MISEIVYPSDDEEGRVRYEGNLKNGIPSGYGKMILKNGETLEGNNNLLEQLKFHVIKLKLKLFTETG
jgi:hypothetical protein